MKLIIASFVLSGLMTSTAPAQTPASAQNNLSTSNSTSLSASKSGVEANSRSSVNETEQTNLTKGNNQAETVDQTQTNSSSHVAVDNSGTANQLKGSEQSLTSGVVKRGTSLSANSSNALVGGAGSGRTGTSNGVANTGTVVRSSIADSAHLTSLSTPATHNMGDRAMSGLQGAHISSTASTSSAVNSWSSGGHVGAAAQAETQKK
jgi:hypothetical protein